MPVYKYRTLDEQRRAHELTADDPRLLDVIRLVWRRAWEMAGQYVPPRGIFKFRSIEEACAHREAWEKERVALLQKRRPPSQPGNSK